jgi:protein phosphatase
LSGDRFLTANIGDSRCYAIDAAGVRQITNDHTVADSLLQQGVLAPEDYESSPLRNQLTKSLGPKSDCEPDIFPRIEFGTLGNDTTFLLCSDGFYSKLTDADLMQLAGSSPDLDAILKRLAADALDRQSTDNISAIAVRFEAN